MPLRDRGATYDATSIILAVISCSIVAARIVFKLLATRSLSSDDIVVLVLVIIAVPSVVITHYGTTPNGVGRDIWTLSPKTITDFLFYFYLMAIFYFTQVMMVKLCLLLFYLRIFPGTTVRRLLWGTVVFTVLFGVVFFFLAIFQCTPVSHFWDHWDGEHEGKCLDLNAIAWANAGISIALDVWMLAIPLAQLKTLNLHWKKKIGVGLMFGVGTLYVLSNLLLLPSSCLWLLLANSKSSCLASVTIVSIIRLQALVVFGKSSNATWDNFPVSLWSTVEINVGIICTCMPTLRLMLVRAFPALGAGSSYGRRTYYNSEGIKGLSSKGRPGRTHENLSSTSKLRGEEPAPVKPLAIVRQQTFAVRYDDDEASLVEMRALDRNGQKHVGDGLM